MQEGISKDTNCKNKFMSTLEVFPALMVFQDGLFNLSDIIKDFTHSH